MISSTIILRDENHGTGHYVGLGLKTVLVYVVFIAALFSVPAAQWFAKQVAAQQVERAVIGETAITLEIAKTDPERVRGLSGRESIPRNHGMLFIFNQSNDHGIWMKGMNFPIDILWLNEYAEVIYIERNVVPESFPRVYKSRKKSNFVLEFNAGFVKSNAIRIGDKLTLL